MLYVGFFLTQIALFKPMGLSLQDRAGWGMEGSGPLRHIATPYPNFRRCLSPSTTTTAIPNKSIRSGFALNFSSNCETNQMFYCARTKSE